MGHYNLFQACRLLFQILLPACYFDPYSKIYPNDHMPLLLILNFTQIVNLIISFVLDSVQKLKKRINLKICSFIQLLNRLLILNGKQNYLLYKSKFFNDFVEVLGKNLKELSNRFEMFNLLKFDLIY
ncbi:hypothetical protein BpHYR1_039273 [Brachionus plicatilis]|uniref:Transmembrane protein n=1 Tax=Brachionus plicatilis TaxID=10195 RepID=A0A3M7SRK8_BRAPC|nr:hypothetical protein BpHYR1_039273 [Brachionus plicatilis]